MLNRIRTVWFAIRESYWFVPSIMLGAAIVLSIVLVRVDVAYGNNGFASIGWIHARDPQGARALLATISGSVITIASIVFSITLVAITLISSQFGTRVLRSFVRDLGNQIALGTFLGTFVYCILVMRTIQDSRFGTFVPHLSVAIGILLAITSLAVLVYFIHHVTMSMQAEQVVANLSSDMLQTIDRVFPQRRGAGGPEPQLNAELPSFDYAEPLSSPVEGYLQSIDVDGIVSTATEKDLVVRLLVRAGNFIVQGETLALIVGDSDEETKVRLAGAFVTGERRTYVQDAAFAARQLVLVAVRTLSPAISDPATVSDCIDHLGAALIHLDSRHVPSPYHFDQRKILRLVANPISVEELADEIFLPMRDALDSNSGVVTLHLLQVMDRILARVENQKIRTAVLHHAHLIAEKAQRTITTEADRAAIRNKYEELAA